VDDMMTLGLMGVACLLLFLVVWRLTKGLVTALLVTLLGVAGVYFLLPILADRDDGVGDAARKTQEVVEDATETVKTVASDEEAIEGLKKAVELGKEAVSGALERAAADAESHAPDAAP
jgi:hypothetical protein